MNPAVGVLQFVIRILQDVSRHRRLLDPYKSIFQQQRLMKASQLRGERMFARNIRILTGEVARGQVVHSRDLHRTTSRLAVATMAMPVSIAWAEGECGAPAAGTGVANYTSVGSPCSAGINYNVYGPGPAEPFTPPSRSGVNVNDGVNLTVTGATIVRDPLAPSAISGAGISVQSWGGGGALVVGMVSVTVTGAALSPQDRRLQSD